MLINIDETIKLLLQARKIIVTAHINPDGDAIGSVLGLVSILREKGISAAAVLDDDIPAMFAILPTAAIEKPVDIEQDIDLLVVLDASLDRIGCLREKYSSVTVLNIDHHRTNDGLAQWLYLDSSRAATAEIIYQIAKRMNLAINKNTAMALYLGMATDTGFFRYANTTSFTLRAAADLLDCGVQPEKISEATETKSYKQIKGMAEALQTLEISKDGRVAGVFLDDTLMGKLESTEGIIDQIRIIEGVDVAILLKYVSEGVCRASMRSKYTDVSQIALSLQGGGHKRAAGCTLHAALPEAKTIVLSAIKQAMEQNNV